MRVPVNWLREYVEFDETPAELASRLTMAGLEVEQIESEGGEAVLEVKVTPNRGDCLSMLGIAREVASFSGKPLKMPAFSLQENGAPTTESISVKIEAPDLCPRYSARVLDNVRIGPSPDWMQRRLTEAGMRPINNVVDCTNYVMMEMGQPLHAFDYELVGGHQIIVRRASKGETIITIDDVERTLNPEILVIADKDRAVAIAGIMGGNNSEVSNKTTRVLLESAHFEPVGNRRGSKILGMSTEASYRYERHVDPEGTVCALDRVCQLIQESSGCKISKGIVDEYPSPAKTATIELRPARSNMILGIDLNPEQMAEMLSRLGFKVSVGNTLSVQVPSWRPDVILEIDLIEEIGRIYGYNNLPTTLPTVAIDRGRDSTYGEMGDKVRGILIGFGMDEVMTHSLVNPRSQGVMSDSIQPVPIRSPLSVDLSVLRTSLVPNLLAVAQRNVGIGVSSIRIFEIGSVFARKAEEDLYEEWREVSGFMMGVVENAGWIASKKPAQVDFFHVKGIIESLLRNLGIPSWHWERINHPALHPGRSARLLVDGNDLGMIGEVHPELAKQYDLPDRAYIFDLRFSDLAEMAGQRPVVFHPLPKFPAITRDLAAVFALTTSVEEIEQAISEAGGDLVESVRLFDVYQGASIPEGYRSLAFSITLRSTDRTLTDEQASATMERIKAALADRHGASFRA